MVKTKFDSLVFECRKCGHLMFVNKDKVEKLLKTNCPECNVEPDRNWTLLGLGNSETLEWNNI